MCVCRFYVAVILVWLRLTRVFTLSMFGAPSGQVSRISSCCSFPQQSFAFSRVLMAHLHFFVFYYPPILFPSFCYICIFHFFVLLYIFFAFYEKRNKNRTLPRAARGCLPLLVVRSALHAYINIFRNDSLAGQVAYSAGYVLGLPCCRAVYIHFYRVGHSLYRQ